MPRFGGGRTLSKSEGRTGAVPAVAMNEATYDRKGTYQYLVDNRLAEDETHLIVLEAAHSLCAQVLAVCMPGEEPLRKC